MQSQVLYPQKIDASRILSVHHPLLLEDGVICHRQRATQASSKLSALSSDSQFISRRVEFTCLNSKAIVILVMMMRRRRRSRRRKPCVLLWSLVNRTGHKFVLFFLCTINNHLFRFDCRSTSQMIYLRFCRLRSPNLQLEHFLVAFRRGWEIP